MKIADPIIDEIRRVRHEISEMNGHDPKRLVDSYMQTQGKHADRLIFKKIKKPVNEVITLKS